MRRARGVALRRVIEQPSTYQLLIEWETLEDHTVAFRQSDDFTRWRNLAGPFFAKAPEVWHSEEVLRRGLS